MCFSCVSVCVVVCMLAFKGLPDKHGGKVGENECLDKGNQNFDHIYKYREGHRHGRKTPTCHATHITEDEDERHET